MARVHIVGAGLAGLSAAVELAGAQGAALYKVALYEAAPQAGGRCRSYFDASLGMTIDNGNHLLLSGNHAALAYAKKIGGDGQTGGAGRGLLRFLRSRAAQRWKLRPNAGKIPWWIFSARPPCAAYGGASIILRWPSCCSRGPTRPCGPFWEKATSLASLWNPLFVSALNTDPAEASAALAGAIVRETFAQGGAACRPLVAIDGLTAAFVDPALDFLRGKGAEIRFGAKLRRIEFEGDRAVTLDFGEEMIALASGRQDRAGGDGADRGGAAAGACGAR